MTPRWTAPSTGCCSLARLCHRSPKDMDTVVRARSSALQKACDHVALSQARLFNAAEYRRRASLVGEIPTEQDNLLQRANELREMGLFRHFADDQLIALAKVVEPFNFMVVCRPFVLNSAHLTWVTMRYNPAVLQVRREVLAVVLLSVALPATPPLSSHRPLQPRLI